MHLTNKNSFNHGFKENGFNKKYYQIAISCVCFASLNYSLTAYADIYKWRNAQGIIQYSDKPPAGAIKISRAEMINALQPKALCADPVKQANTTNIEANFFGFSSPKAARFAGQPAKNVGAFGNAGFNGSGFNGFAKSANQSSAANLGIKNSVTAPFKPAIAGFTPRNSASIFGFPTNRPPKFAGLNPTSMFNNGKSTVTVFGKPFNVAAAKPPVSPMPVNAAPVNNLPAKPPVPAPTPAPVAPEQKPTIPTSAPAPLTGNVVQVGLMPAVDISKNMAPAIGANEPFIGPAPAPAPGDGDGQFRTICRPSHMGNDDPIIYPNQQGAAHHHTFFGNTSLNFKSDVTNLRSAGNSTCKGGTANLSAYWVPSMIDSATNTPLVPNDAVFYYKTGYTVKRELVKPPPKGLRIIAGNGKSSVSQRIDKYLSRVHYSCVLPGNKVQPESDSIPACSQGSEIHSVIQFPNCWDGKNLDSPDHQSHMAYAKYGEGCPATHTTAIPTITFNIFYKVTQAAGTANWRLASDNYAKNGYNAGYSSHADWVNGWDVNILKIAIENCDNKGLDCGVGNLGNGTALWLKKDSEY